MLTLLMDMAQPKMSLMTVFWNLSRGSNVVLASWISAGNN